MASYEWFLVDLINLIYNLTWLVFLTYKHYGQVTTTAGHIFELNVLMNVTITNFVLILIVDPELLPKGIISDILDAFNIYKCTFLVAIAGSQIETVVFLKTLNVNTMLTNTAGKIIFAMTMFSYVLAVINILALPSTNVHESDILFCDHLTPMDFYRVTLPGTVVLMIILSVLGFAVFRGFQLRRRRDSEEPPENLNAELGELGQGHEFGNGNTPSQGRLFTIQSMISELNQETPRVIEEDLVIQDIELASMETCFSSSSIDHGIQDIEPASTKTCFSINNVMTNEMGCVPVPLPPGVEMIMKSIQKYMKNTMISLLILTSLLPWYSAGLYGFITESGCEDPTIKALAEMTEYGWYMLTIFLPLLIKFKLDRLSE